jgi:hypothetical protein
LFRMSGLLKDRLRQAQHERNWFDYFEFPSVRPEPVEGLRGSFLATC